MSTNSTHLVFSYGTLKRSERNHRVMILKEKGTSRFVGSGQTMNKFPLVIGTKFNIPFMIDMENKGHNVLGEIFEIDDKMLEFLDEFEGHPRLYKRQVIPVTMTADGNDKPVDPHQTRQCWTYFLSKIEETDLLENKWIAEFRAEATEPVFPLEEIMKGKSEIEKMLFQT